MICYLLSSTAHASQAVSTANVSASLLRMAGGWFGGRGRGCAQSAACGLAKQQPCSRLLQQCVSYARVYLAPGPPVPLGQARQWHRMGGRVSYLMAAEAVCHPHTYGIGTHDLIRHPAASRHRPS